MRNFFFWSASKDTTSCIFVLILPRSHCLCTALLWFQKFVCIDCHSSSIKRGMHFCLQESLVWTVMTMLYHHCPCYNLLMLLHIMTLNLNGKMHYQLSDVVLCKEKWINICWATRLLGNRLYLWCPVSLYSHRQISGRVWLDPLEAA